MISTDDALATLADEVRRASWIAVDTEADSLHAYPERLCLIQISIPGSDHLVDPLSGVDLWRLLGALRDRELIFHGADFDLRLLRRTHGFVPHRVFDTMLAARLVGEPRWGLSALVESHLGIALEKESRKANWAKRPLSDKMATYALNDTRHLRDVSSWLTDRLDTLGRRAWHRESCERLVAECAAERRVDDDEVWRIKGSDHLQPRALAFLREISAWREEEAIAANRPPYFIVSHEALVRLAEVAAVSDRVPTLPRRLSRRRAEGLVAALRRAHALPESDLPERKKRKRRSGGRLKGLAAEIKTHRDAVAASLGLDPTLIASRATIEKIAAAPDAAGVELMSWQRDLLADVLEGRSV